MALLEPRVVIFENNATRADLYERWLSGYAVRTATTRREALEAFDETVAVAILDEDFADGAAEKVLDMIGARSPDCRVLTTAENRDRIFPSFDVDEHMAKPIFERDLRETVDRLALRALYASTLKRYYSLTLELTSTEITEEDDEAVHRRRSRLQERVQSLKSRLASLTRSMDADAFHSALTDLTDDAGPIRTERTQDSKYVPRRCAKCKCEWTGEDSTTSPVRLGSFVWRCTECGHVQMHADPDEGQVAMLR